MTQAPDAHAPHVSSAAYSRFCYDLCCRQMDNLSSWGTWHNWFPLGRCPHWPGGKGGAWCCTTKAQIPPETLSPAHFFRCPEAQLLSEQWYPGLTEVPEGCTPTLFLCPEQIQTLP